MYIDAGTGSMMIQIIAGSLFTIVLFFKSIRERFRRTSEKCVSRGGASE